MPAFADNTKVNTGSVTSPGGAASITALGAPAEGVYCVTVIIALTGTAETTLNNLRLRENGTNVATLPSIPGVVQTITLPRVEVNPGGGNMDVATNAGAVAGAIYTVTLIATRIG